LQWTQDGLRLFLGIKPESEMIVPEEEKPDSLLSLYSTEDILTQKGVDIWHWNDPYINPQQKIRWKEEKNRTYTGVYYPGKDLLVPLSNPDMPSIRISENPQRILGSSNVPYAKMATWDSRYSDYYLVDLETGSKELVIEKHQGRPSLSPDGKYLVWYQAGDWYLMNTSGLESIKLTAGMDVSFADEDWDYPADTPGYGVADWLDASKAVLIYDKYDIWKFPVDGSEPLCLTEGSGRSEKLQFRIRQLDREKKFLESGETLLLTAYHDLEKYTALYSMNAGKAGLKLLAEGPNNYTPVAKAEEADKLLYTRQSYTEFPDVWVSGLQFKKPLKLSSLNPQMEEIAWGEAELVEWSSADGTPLQGILIKPGNYEAGKKYPVLVYYYRFFSNRLYDFNQVVLSHRPCFPFYASNGYAIFLPDIRFDVGNPGYSATKCLVPGVQKIIDMGVADPEAICLHGHSWSGYQTAFAITQTDIFTCAIAGAPVSNMTSAYSGIRWGSGLARQFQYEKTQSRIGGSLWESRDLYIENSPVFFADRIHTPLLIMFGDEDDAVPWYQGIELYLAMRRLGKDCIFLQYRDEPHHPKKYANKLDCTLRYKEYLDHYLKKEPPAEWISKGIPYTGK
jgi:dipeptidyl aminopeptidase/acylaminoacyl peptidase